MRWTSRRGSILTEAAMVMPLVILAVMSVLVILLIFHQRTGIKAQLHQVSRSVAAQVGGVWLDMNREETDSGQLYQRDLYGSFFGAAEAADQGEQQLQRRLADQKLLPTGYQLSVRHESALLFPRIQASARGLFGGMFLLAEREEESQVSTFVVNEAQLLRNVEFALEKGALWLGDEK